MVLTKSNASGVLLSTEEGGLSGDDLSVGEVAKTKDPIAADNQASEVEPDTLNVADASGVSTTDDPLSRPKNEAEEASTDSRDSSIDSSKTQESDNDVAGEDGERSNSNTSSDPDNGTETQPSGWDTSSDPDNGAETQPSDFNTAESDNAIDGERNDINTSDPDNGTETQPSGWDTSSDPDNGAETQPSDFNTAESDNVIDGERNHSASSEKVNGSDTQSDDTRVAESDNDVEGERSDSSDIGTDDPAVVEVQGEPVALNIGEVSPELSNDAGEAGGAEAGGLYAQEDGETYIQTAKVSDNPFDVTKSGNSLDGADAAKDESWVSNPKDAGEDGTEVSQSGFENVDDSSSNQLSDGSEINFVDTDYVDG